MGKEILYGAEARVKLLSGMEKVFKAVKTTLGPRGRDVLIDKRGTPVITKDGVTVAQAIILKDKVENSGAALLKQVSSKTAEDAGDGTTTSTVLGYCMAKEGIEVLGKGVPPIELKKGIDIAAEEVCGILKKVATPVTSKNDLVSIATISANNDEEIGKIVADVFERIGVNGIVTTEVGGSLNTTVDYTEGMELDYGCFSSYILGKSGNVEYEDCKILLTDKKYVSAKEILPILNMIADLGIKNGGKKIPLLMFCDELDGEALAAVIKNVGIDSVRVVPVRTPYAGETRREFMNDLAAVVGGTYIAEASGLQVSVEALGSAKKVRVDMDKTIIAGGSGNKKDIDERIKKLESDLEKPENNEMAIKLYKERLSKLKGGVAIIKVGCATEVEAKEKQFRYDDTISAVRSAIQEGIVPGGGITLYKISKMLEGKKLGINELIGYNIVKKALESPFENIYNNAGLDIDAIKKQLDAIEDFSVGVTIDNKEVDFLKKGIVDPVKVTRSAVMNAASVAGHVVMTETVIVDEDK